MSDPTFIDGPFTCGPDEVFVEVYDYDQNIPSWEKRKVMSRIETKIIRCAWCSKPARRIDCHWPWMSGLNACEEHMDKGDRDG